MLWDLEAMARDRLYTKNIKNMSYCDALHGDVSTHRMTLFPYLNAAKRNHAACPRDCVNYIYQMKWNNFEVEVNLGTEDDLALDYSTTNTILLTADMVPFVYITKKPSMTELQLLCNVAAMISMLYGWCLVDLVRYAWRAGQRVNDALMRACVRHVHHVNNYTSTSSTQHIQIYNLANRITVARGSSWEPKISPFIRKF